MKYLLLYFAVASVAPPATQFYIGGEPGQWTAEVKTTQAECMATLKRHIRPGYGFCIPAHGYTEDKVPY